MNYAKAFAGFILVYLFVDFFWMSLVIKSLYTQEVGHLLRSSPNVGAAIVFYILYAASIVYLVRHSISNDCPRSAFSTGVIVGLLAYGTFTLTNYAVLQGWTLTLVTTDIAWGMFITGFSALPGIMAVRLWPNNR